MAGIDRQLDLFAFAFPAASLEAASIGVAGTITPAELEPPSADVDIAAMVDGLLMTYGEVRLRDCLRLLGMLADGAAAPSLPASALDGLPALTCSNAAAIEMLELARDYGLAQGLTEQRSTSEAGPVVGAKSLAALCQCVLLPSEDREQADLFIDNALAVALHSLRQALAEHQLAKAEECLQRLVALDAPEHADYAQLLGAIAAPPASAAQRLQALQRDIGPLALRRLGRLAESFLQPLWIDLARQLADQAYSADAPELHASHAYARAGQWPQVIESAQREAAWQQQPVLIARVAEANARLLQRAAARQAWARLCWSFPAAAEGLLARAPGDAALARSWQAFGDAELELPTVDFPAWLLVADPQQQSLVPAALADADDCGRAYVLLHRLVTSGGAMPERKALHALRPELLRLYLAARRQ